MDAEEFPCCCGATILCDFMPSGSWQPPRASAVYKQILKYKNENKGNAFILAILNAYQKHLYHKVMVKAGFKPMSTGINRRNDQQLTIYVFTNRKRGSP